MFTVNAPESPHLGSVEVSTLKKAIQTKHAWQVNQRGCHAIITDNNGYVVSSHEQSMYLSYQWNRPV
jgi:hypothetical protein